ncbi:SPOR domain-containing protein [Brevundimonas vesicularis]|uniref:SPOR domain-containing protein n=1 Tax=Brevundimonas vesicularis TaxID=41276 RepID=A0A1Z3UAU8_BREVE|nr:SPOR domain-containing protein [Brevundimonas vesicularis]ASE40365.1 SPOR domain-containing protein [Brevundimonas vesicularis]MDX2334827.1 SPOR domain-containing protein [Brevundimonas vesicularis]
MSFEDDNKPGRGAYTPPTDDDLPFRRNSYDPRSGRNVGAGGGKAPPVTLIISAVVLLLLIVAVIFFYRSGMRASTDAPPAVGQPVGEMKTAAPIDAQPIDPAAGVRVYRDETETTDAPVTFTPPPEAPQPRPAAPPTAAPTGQGLPPAKTATPAAPAPRPTTPAPAPVAAPATKAPAATGGSASVQIGAFSSTEIADREYAAVAGRFGAFASGAEKRVTEVTSSSGSTLYRTAFSGLSRERAVAFCNALKAAGRDCIVR